MAFVNTPQQVKSDEELADAVEAWEREEREFCYGDQTMTLTDQWEVT